MSDGESRQEKAASATRSWFIIMTLLTVALFSHLDRTIISILQVPIKAELGLTDAQLGGLTGLAFALVYSAFAVPMARLADRTNRKRLMAAALLFWSGMTAISGMAANYLTLVLCRMGVAMGESVCSPTSLSLISDYFPPRKRALPIAVWSTAVPLGTMLALTAGGWLAAAYGWRATLFIIGACGIVPFVMLLILREPPRDQFDTITMEQPSLRDALALLFASRAFRLLLLGGTLHSYVVVSMQFWLAPFYVRVHDLPLAQTGLALGILFGAGGGLGALAGGMIASRTVLRDAGSYGWIAATGCILMMPAGLVQLLSGNVLVSLGAGVIAMVMMNIYIAPFNAACQSLVPSRMRAFTSSVILITSNMIGAGGGPFLTGLLSDGFSSWLGSDTGVRFALCCALPAAIGAAISFFLSSRHLRQELSDTMSAPARSDSGETDR